jgi:uncharacterized protein YbjT (DUF2867 family)
LKVRAGARRLDAIHNKNWPGVECQYVDALSEASLAEALKGISTVYYLIHSMNSGAGFSEREIQCAENFARAAKHANVSHVIYMGALTPERDLSEHLNARKNTGQCLRESGLTVTEIRAGIVVGPGSAAYEVIRDLVNALPIMITPKWVHTQSPPIALTNLLYYLTELPLHPELHGKTLDVAGPERLSYAQLMLQYGELVKRNPPILPVPLLTPKLSSYWLRLVTAVPTNLARALIDGLSHDLTANDDTIRKAIPQRLLTYREAVQQALMDDQNLQVYTRWVEGAIQFRNYRTDTSFYAKQCVVDMEGEVDVESLWHRVTHMGGDQGYPALNWLWNLRAWIDWAVGGPGRNRGRAHDALQVGDTIDSWRVVAMEPGRSISLLMGMKAPGEGVLQLTCDPIQEGSRLKIAAYWHPSNVFGHLYWASLWPVHLVLFDRMAKTLLKP